MHRRPDAARAAGCDRQMIQKEMCSARVPVCQGRKIIYRINLL